jgi:hypothetical protein
MTLTVDAVTLATTADMQAGHVTVIAGNTFYDPGNDSFLFYLARAIFPGLTNFTTPISPGMQPWLEENAPPEESGLCQALVYLRILAYARGDTTGHTEKQLVYDGGTPKDGKVARQTLIRLVTGLVAARTSDFNNDPNWTYDPTA